MAKKTCYVTFILIQEVDENESDSDEEFNCIGFYVAQTSQMRRKKLTLWEGDIVAKSRFESRRTVFVEAIVQGKEVPYIIIPATYDPEELGKYNLQVFSNEEVTLEPIGEEGDHACEQGGSSAHPHRQYSAKVTQLLNRAAPVPLPRLLL